jgi:dynein assembly factor with WDR repeat domains 1
MKLKRFLIRYHPPALILEFTHSTGEVGSKTIELFDLTCATDVNTLASKIMQQEPLISSAVRPQLMLMLNSLLLRLR